MSSHGRTTDPRIAAEAAILVALERSSLTTSEIEKARATGGVDIDACLTRLVGQGRVVQIEGEPEDMYEMTSVGS